MPEEKERTLFRTSRRTHTIRTRLSVSHMLAVLLPVAVIGAALIITGSRTGRQQATNQLESVASIKEAEVDNWTKNLQADLDGALGGSQVMPRLLVLLQTSDPSESQEYWLRSHIQQTVEQAERFEELFLINLEGRVVLSTDVAQEEKDLSDQPYFQSGLADAYIQPPAYSPLLGQVEAFVARPVVGPDRQVLGVLVGRVNPTTLSEIMGERAWLGDTGEVYLADHNHVLLTELRFDKSRDVPMHTDGVGTAIEKKNSGSILYEDYRGVPVIGVYHWLPELQATLVAKQDQSEALRITNSMLRVMGYVGLGAVAIAVAASLLVTRSIAEPLSKLTETATQVAAGDLTLSAPVVREDEVGAVARAFNSMTLQLRNLIDGLERRVAERTQEVEVRSAYLEASAEVGRAASSILDPDQLIRQTVELIRERFSLYYVGIFLVDETGEWAVLRAGTGQAGQAMLARGHRIRISKGMVGWSVANAEARVALEAGGDSVRLATAELPETRSEAAIPLRSRGQVLGALTVQDTRLGAFEKAAITVLQMMADQVAVALDNARLFVESQQALEAERRAYGELSRRAWRELLHVQPKLNFLSNQRGVTSLDEQPRPEIEIALRTGQVTPGDDNLISLAMPVEIRGQVIGAVGGRKAQKAGEWTVEEIALMQTLTDQLGVALESARLYQDTQRRAARERLTREITNELHRATSAEGIVQTAVDALFEVLGTSRAYGHLEATPPDQEIEQTRL
jgi:GAF domain-containing protein/HAMP domain-containing protein